MFLFGILLSLVVLCSIRFLLGQYLWYERSNASQHQAPCVGSYTRHLDLMKAKLDLESNKKLVDLGCGDGKVLRFFAQEYKLSQIDGYDNNRIAIWWGGFLNWIMNISGISLIEKDFMQISLDEYDYIYLFLLSPQLDSIQKRLQNNMKTDAIIICNTFAFSDRTPSQEIVSDDKKSIIRLYTKNLTRDRGS